MQKIHFINRIDKANAGDWACSPLNYYYDYFKNFSLIVHDIDFIDFNEIERNDVVILGGSGLFDVTESFNNNINMLLDKCPNVIAWSAGFNTHDSQWYQGDDFTKINFEKFLLLSIRDYNHPSQFRFLPCPSVKAFSNYNEIKRNKYVRKIGIIEHKDLPINCDLNYEKIKNNISISEIEEFILSSEIIITNSYHCAYWSILLQRKTIVVNKFSSKFDFFKYKPEFISLSFESIDKNKVINSAIDRAKIYPEAYEEAIKLNDVFAQEVISIICEIGIEKNTGYQNVYQLKDSKSWNLNNKLNEIGLLYDQINHIHKRIDCLHDEIYSEINVNHSYYIGENSRIHKELHTRIDLSHRELVELISNLHDEMYEKINMLQAEINNINKDTN